MAASKRFPSLKPLPITSYQQQRQRTEIAPGWQPRGFERYAEAKQCLDSMPVLGAGGTPGYSAERFQPVGPLEVDFPVHS